MEIYHSRLKLIVTILFYLFFLFYETKLRYVIFEDQDLSLEECESDVKN